MPYPSEHAARVMDPEQCDSFKRMNQGSGVSLILCISKDGKSSAQSYRFKKDQFTVEQAKAWLAKHEIKYKTFEEASEDEKVEAKLSMKASKPEIDGRIWSAGMHHVFVNDKPARVYVPEATVMQTFGSMRKLIDEQGRMPIGIDHLSDSILSDNEILAKMNLLDVGNVSKVGTDGQSIYILDSELTNQQIRDLNSIGELPAYSIVGAMDAKPCPSGKADYVVESIDVERVDIVQEGGCQVCKVGAQPDNLILTSKKSMEDIKMVEANEAPVKKEEVEETEEDGLDEAVEEVKEDIEEIKADAKEIAEDVEEAIEDSKELVKDAGETIKDAGNVVKEAAEDVKEEVEDDIAAIKEELAKLKEMLEGKKPKVEAKASEFDAEQEVELLIQAGKAYPKMKDGLMKMAQADEDGFKEFAASMPTLVEMGIKSKLSKIDEQTKKAKKKPTWDEEYADMAKAFRL